MDNQFFFHFEPQYDFEILDMSNGKLNCTELMNFIFTGNFCSDDFTDDQLLEGYRKSTSSELLKRYRQTMRHYAGMNMPDFDSFNPYETGLERIRKRFGVSDIIKLWETDGTSYDRREFSKVYQALPNLARDYYHKYVLHVLEPKDIEMHGEHLGVVTGDQHIMHALSIGAKNKLQTYLKLYNGKSLEISYRDISGLLHDDEQLLVELFEIILSKGVEIECDDSTTQKILDKCGKH